MKKERDKKNWDRGKGRNFNSEKRGSRSLKVRNLDLNKKKKKKINNIKTW